MIKSETFDSGTVSSAISWNPTTKVMTETITLPSGKEIVETTLKGLPETLEYDGSKLLQYNYGTGNVLTSIRKNFDLQDNHSAELSYTYNNWRKVSRRTEEFTAQNAPTVADYEYTYSKGLHLIGKQENEENRRTAYQYDSYYRLRRVDYDCAYSSSDPTCIENRTNVFKCNSSETDCEDFQLDGVHNIRSSRENQTDFSWTVDGFNRLEHKSWNNTTTTYSYDSNNNMTGEDLDGDNNPEIVYTYDKLNRLTSVTNSDYLVEYSYDPFNRRTEKTIYYADGNDTFERTHKYAYNDWDIISEEIKTLRTSDNPVTTTVWELRRYVDQGTDNHIIMDTVSCSDDGNGNCSPNESTLQRIWFHKDERGNIIAISDGNGTIYERYRYRVYGEHEVLNADFTPKTTAAVSPFLWGGSLYEPETNLYWMRNRYYHTGMHRFINQDPIGIWGDANNLGNGFAYVAGMVIEASDPSGLEIKPIYFTDGKYFLPNFVEDAWAKQGHEPSAELLEQSKDLATQSFVIRTPTGEMKYADIIELISNLMVFVNTLCDELEKTLVEANHRKYGFKDDDIIYQKTFKDNDGKFLGEATIYADRSFTFSYKDKNGNGFEVDFNSRGIRIEKREYKNKRLVKRWKWQVVGKDESGNDIYDWVEVPVDLMPSDPYSDNDAQQNFVRNQFLKKILEVHEKKSSLEMMNEVGPVIKYDDNGRKVFILNPYYRSKDPMKQIFWETKNADGTKGFVRNPFAPKAEYGYDSTTYEKWQQAGFPQTNVDPYFN